MRILDVIDVDLFDTHDKLHSRSVPFDISSCSASSEQRRTELLRNCYDVCMN